MEASPCTLPEAGDSEPMAAVEVLSVERSADDTVAWIADRFAGRPAPTDCATL